MRCNKAREYLGLELDGMVPPDAAVELEQHVDTCPECREYRSDLLLGQRLLAATEPELPENFDWKLQLRLSQTLREAAGNSAYPWEEPSRDWWGWFRTFGAATAVGMAAVLTFAIFVGPAGPLVDGPANYSGPNEGLVGGTNDRLPLQSDYRLSGLRVGNPAQQQVSGMTTLNGGRVELDRGWSGGSVRDLQTISRLKQQNQRLNFALEQARLQLQFMQARLDTSGLKDLDLGER